MHTRTERAGRDFMVPVSRGHIKWKPQPWGAVVTESIYGYEWTPTVLQEIRIPWSVLERMLETRNINGSGNEVGTMANGDADT